MTIYIGYFDYDFPYCMGYNKQKVEKCLREGAIHNWNGDPDSVWIEEISFKENDVIYLPSGECENEV